ncbi:MAG: threonine ammonia-lyase [Thermoplasmata archaeon]|nr:threonine ammonia-lyase [Thermoplasmata archaeon]
MGSPPVPLPVTLADVRAAAVRIRGAVRRTPLVPLPAFPGLPDVPVYLKLENLQLTGAFKLRGATNHLAQLPTELARAGVVTASAGNHAQGVAWAARSLGIPATIVMATAASPFKVSATSALGARVILHGADYEEAHEEAVRLAREEHLAYVPPFDDAQVIAGQGTVGLEIMEELPDTRRIIAGVGGGGLLAGIAVAACGISDKVAITGIQPAGADTFRSSLAEGRVVVGGRPRTFADGLATRHVGDLPLTLLRALGASAYAVDDLEIARAVFLLLEKAKLLAEGAGAIPLAGLLAHPEIAAPGPVVLVISGGNIDPFLLDRVLWIGLSAEGRLLRLRAALPDIPGRLAEFLTVAADAGANVRQIEHDRESPAHGPGEVTVEVELEVRNPAHAREVAEAYGRRGFPVERLGATGAESAPILHREQP